MVKKMQNTIIILQYKNHWKLKTFLEVGYRNIQRKDIKKTKATHANNKDLISES